MQDTLNCRTREVSNHLGNKCSLVTAKLMHLNANANRLPWSYSLLWVWQSTGTELPEVLASPFLDILKTHLDTVLSRWHLGHTCSRWACFSSRISVEDFQRSFPISNILWFCALLRLHESKVLWPSLRWKFCSNNQVETSFKTFNLRLLKNALNKKKFVKQILFICMYIHIHVWVHVRGGGGMCLYTQDIVDIECFLMPISTVHETNTFDLNQKHIPTDSSLFKLSKYDKFF